MRLIHHTSMSRLHNKTAQNRISQIALSTHNYVRCVRITLDRQYICVLSTCIFEIYYLWIGLYTPEEGQTSASLTLSTGRSQAINSFVPITHTLRTVQAWKYKNWIWIVKNVALGVDSAFSKQKTPINVGLMLNQRSRLSANIDLTLVKHHLIANLPPQCILFPNIITIQNL